MTRQQTWIVIHGSTRKVFYTEYHADQYARALRLNGTQHQTISKVPIIIKGVTK